MIWSLHFKKRLSVFFLLAFVFIKVGGLHSLTHTEEANDLQECVWCHLSGTDAHTPLLVAGETYEILSVPVIQPLHLQDTHYRSVVSSKTPVCLIFNKPPPFYTV